MIESNDLRRFDGLRTRAPLILVAAGALALGACTEAESRDAPAETTVAEEAPAPVVPAGASMAFVVDRTVSTDTDQPGSEFTASLQTPLHADDGSVVAAAGTPSQWVVTDASSDDGQSVLAFRLESIQVDGEWRSVTATVTEATLDVDEKDSDSETAAKIGIGAAAGALVGQVVGRDTEATLVGAGVGAAVGTAVALSTRDGHATLPEGSILEVRLDEAISIR